MHRFTEGDCVRIDIPDKGDPDHTRFHDRLGEVIEVEYDDAGTIMGDERYAVIYRVELKTGEEVDLRWRDLRPY